MTKDELIRVLASVRTDLNKSRLIILALPGQLDDETLLDVGLDIEVRQGESLDMLTGVVSRLNDIIKLLGGKA